MQQMKRANTTERFRRMGLLVALGGAAAIAVPTSGHAADACAAIKDLKIEDTTITSSESVPAGSFTAPNSKSYANLPAFCRVTATLSPMHDSAIRVEMWLPQGGWKGVFEGTGNGGYSGVFNYPILAAGLSRGYAVINTDEGTAPATPLNGDAVVGHPVKWRDWGFRSTHLMTVAGKQIARAFYSKEPDHAYFSGCSTGGQQALSEAQLYPADYDGIAAGAPVVNRTHLHAAFVWSRQAAERSPGSVLGHDKLMLLKKAVVAACAPGTAGVASDTFVADPLHCAFDPASLVCKAGDAPDCLTQEQAETVKRFYAGPTNPRTGEQIYPGWPRGSEGPAFGWALEEGDAPFSLKEPAFDSLFKWVFGPTWDWRTFDFDRDMAEVDAVLGPDVNGKHGRQHRRLQGAWREIASLSRVGGFDRQPIGHGRLLRKRSPRRREARTSWRVLRVSFFCRALSIAVRAAARGRMRSGASMGCRRRRLTRNTTFLPRWPNGLRPEPRQRS